MCYQYRKSIDKLLYFIDEMQSVLILFFVYKSYFCSVDFNEIRGKR